MTAAARERLKVRVPALCLSGAAWIALALHSSCAGPHAHHRAARHGMGSWALMLAAMMAPLVIAPVRHVLERSFARRRARAVALFVAGYAAVWMAAGAALTAIAAPAIVGIAIAAAWEVSPFKQRCLNRGHAHPELPAFGAEADLGALRFGVVHGLWCVGSCWALMFAPLLFAGGHLVAMAAASVWLYAERLERPAAPRWRLRVPSRALRLATVWIPVRSFGSRFGGRSAYSS